MTAHTCQVCCPPQYTDVGRILAMLEARRDYWAKAYAVTPFDNIQVSKHEVSRAIVAICDAFRRPLPEWWGGAEGKVAGFDVEEPSLQELAGARGWPTQEMEEQAVACVRRDCAGYPPYVAAREEGACRSMYAAWRRKVVHDERG